MAAETTEFEIQFIYDGISYSALITPGSHGDDIWYAVNFESNNQETFMEITAKPSANDSGGWEYYCGAGENAERYYDQDLLYEIGEAIEKYETRTDS